MAAIGEFDRKLNHDVKATEYYIRVCKIPLMPIIIRVNWKIAAYLSYRNFRTGFICFAQARISTVLLTLLAFAIAWSM